MTRKPRSWYRVLFWKYAYNKTTPSITCGSFALIREILVAFALAAEATNNELFSLDSIKDAHQILYKCSKIETNKNQRKKSEILRVIWENYHITKNLTINIFYKIEPILKIKYICRYSIIKPWGLKIILHPTDYFWL